MIELRDYQKGIVQTIVNREHVLIVAPMGAGKTVSTLTALTALIAQGKIETALIIAPKRVAMSVWAQEAEKSLDTLLREEPRATRYHLCCGQHHATRGALLSQQKLVQI